MKMQSAARRAGFRTRWPAWLEVLALLMLAAALRMLWLDSAPLGGVELFSIDWSLQDSAFLLGPGLRAETNPPGYFLLLKAWIGLLGPGAGAVRLLSVLCSTAQAPVAYALGRLLLDRPAALLAGVLTALDPAAVLFGQLARTYATLGLLDGVALLGLAAYWRSGRRRWLMTFVFAASGTMMLHYSSLVFVAACLGAWGIGLAATRPFPAAAARVWGGAALLLALVAMLPLSLAAALRHSANIDWIEPLSPAAILVFFLDLLTQGGLLRGAAALDAFAMLLAILLSAVPHWRWGRVSFGVLVLIPALFCLLLLGISLARPILAARTGAWLVLPLCLLLAGAITAQPDALRRAVTGAATLLIFLLCLGHYFLAENREDWRGIALLLAHDPHCTGPVLVSGDSALGLDYFAPALRRRPVMLFTGADSERTTAEFLLTERVMHAPAMPAAAVAGFAAAHAGTAVILREAFPQDAPPPLLAALAQAPYRTTRGGGLRIACF